MRIGKWSDLRVDRVCQEHEVMSGADANEISCKLGSPFGGTLGGGVSQRIPLSEALIESAILVLVVYPPHLPLFVGGEEESDHTASGTPASLSLHLTSSSQLGLSTNPWGTM